MSRPESDPRRRFLNYARIQHEVGVELALRHVVEGTGCCRSCGRIFPCDGYQRGQEMKAHYQPWLVDSPLRVGASGDIRLGP